MLRTSAWELAKDVFLFGEVAGIGRCGSDAGPDRWWRNEPMAPGLEGRMESDLFRLAGERGAEVAADCRVSIWERSMFEGIPAGRAYAGRNFVR